MAIIVILTTHLLSGCGPAPSPSAPSSPETELRATPTPVAEITLTPPPSTPSPATLTPTVELSPTLSPGPALSPVIPTETLLPASPTPVETSTPTLTPEPTRSTAGLTLPADYEARVVVRGLQGPTQMIIGPDGAIWIAQLTGDENAGQGQVVAVSPTSGEQRVLLTGLFKPTGIAVLAGMLWIASGRDLLRAPLSDEGQLGAIETILKDLPFNGRSEGTLTVSPAGRLIFETSGQRNGSQMPEDSARLWELDPADPSHPRPIATGLKNAYAHTFDAAGRLWTTDVLDDPVNGEAPPDELNLVVEGANFGWLPCFGYQQPALNYGGSEESCRVTRPPVALFLPHSTPTSVVVSPWEENTLLVALWGPPERAIVKVPFSFTGDNAIGQVEPFITGMQNPQHLLLPADGSLLVSDFTTGLIYRITQISSNN